MTMDEVLQLAHWARTAPHESALLAPGQEPLTYGVLLPLVRQGRRELLDAGLRAEEAAGVLMVPTLGSVATFLAVAGTSACVPLDPALTVDEYVNYLKRVRLSTLVMPENAPSSALAAAHQLGLLALRTSLSGTGGDYRLEVETLLPRASHDTGREARYPLILLTSSTTGDSKAVPVSSGNLTARCAADGRSLLLTPRDRLLNLMPLFHTFGLDRLMAQLHFGGSVICVPGFDPVLFSSWWNQWRPSWVTAGVPVLHALASAGPPARESFAAAPPRFILAGAATPEPRLCEAVSQIVRAPVVVGYGSSETGPITRTPIGRAKPLSVGITFGPEIALGDPSGGRVPANRQGEVLLRGPGIFSGYLDDEAANTHAFRDGWYRTGDLGHLDEDGFLFLTGRLKEIISRGSEKIRPVEVDSALASHPAVHDVASFGVPHQTLGEDVAAAVVIREGAKLTEAELRRYAATRLAAFKIPRSIVFLDSIPRTASGKPKRALLAQRHAEAAPRQRATDLPLTGVERRIIEIWSEILGDTRISAYDDFIRLGGDSLRAARMLADVDAAFNAGGRVMARTDFLR